MICRILFSCVIIILGVPLVPEKTVGPDTVLQFAGITLDSLLFEACLPEDKLAKCRVMLHNFYTRRTVTRYLARAVENL